MMSYDNGVLCWVVCEALLVLATITHRGNLLPLGFDHHLLDLPQSVDQFFVSLMLDLIFVCLIYKALIW